MLEKFIKKVEKKRETKIFNIESIRESITSKENISNLLSDSIKSEDEEKSNKKVENTNKKDNKFEEHPNLKVKRAEAKKIKKTKLENPLNLESNSLEYYNFTSDTSFVVSNSLIQPGAKPNQHNNMSINADSSVLNSKIEDICSPSNLTDLNVDNSLIDDRKSGVMNFSKQSLQMKYSPSNAALYLPKIFKQISDLYKIILITFNFNKKRGLSLIFIKHKESIERLFKHRVEISHLEQLNFIANGTINFIELQVRDENKTVNTFKIDILQSIDIDFALFNCFNEIYQKWLHSFIFGNHLEIQDKNIKITGNEAIDNLQSKEIEESDNKSALFTFYLRKIHPEFKQDGVAVPYKPFLTAVKPVEMIKDPRSLAKIKTGSILDRIKEKERLGREAFILDQSKHIDYPKKLSNLFEIEQKEALRFEDVLFKIGGFDCKAQIMKILDPDYIIKDIRGVKYIVKVK